MAQWKRFASAVGEARILAVLGGLYAAIAATHSALLWRTGQPLSDVVPTHMLIGLPGVILLYGGYRLPGTELHPDVYPRIVARCLAGIGVMLGVVGLLAIGTPEGLNRPFFTPVAGTALGSVAGVAIGLNEARALSKAHEAEQHRDELLQERNLRERIVQTSPIGIAVIEADGTLSFTNERAAEIIGHPEDELVGREYDTSMFEATDSDSDPVEEGVFEQVLSTGEPVYDAERKITRADGRRIWLSVNAAPLYDSSGDVTGVIFTAEDVTERKEREAELTLFRSLIDRSNDAVFVIDPETGQFRDVNETACRRLGYDREDLLDLTVPDIEANLPNLEAWRAHVDDVRAEGALTFEGEHERADGTTIPVEVSVNYVALDREYLFAIARDVTERQEYEWELEERNERLESFASMLAHELRNPVTIGQIYSQQLPAETDAEAVEYVAEAFDRIEDMIDVMLVLTRGREVVSECSSVNLEDVAREAWDDVDAPEATLDVAIERTIQADETYVRHLFRNLFENAVEHGSTSPRSQAHEDAVEHGSASNQSPADDVYQTSSDAAHQNPSDSEDVVEQSSAARETASHGAVEHGGTDVTVTVGELPSGFYVADDGTGISAGERDAVFEAGYTTAADGGGTGLGLAFVQELAEIYDWTCTVTESDAGGAQFEFQNADRN